MKLYGKEKEIALSPSLETKILESDSDKDLDKDMVALEQHIKAFNSLTIIDEQITAENYNFIDKGNYILYNEYIKSITSNLNMKYVPVLAQETVNALPNTALNHHIALEGFLGDMWTKIKEIFNKIYNSIKEFFKKYFTRLGRLKNKINNLIEVLGETTKDIKQMHLEPVPGGIASKYPFSGTIDSGVINETYMNLAVLVNSFDEINKKAEAFANKDILDKDFVANIIKLKDEIKNNKAEQDKLGSVKKHIPLTDDHAKNKELNKDNKAKGEEIKKSEDTIKDIVGKESNLDMDDVKGEEAKREFSNFIKSLGDLLNKVKGKPLVNGKTITEIKVDEESGIEIETDQNKETPQSITLEDKSSLLKMLKTLLEAINESEKLTSTYGKINDKIMDNLNKVDKLMNDISKLDDAELGKYKKLLNNKIKVKLNLAKTFFNNYNKICKNMLEMTLDCGDGVCDYATLSLKHFG